MAASGSVALSSSLHLSSLVSGRDNCCTTDTKSGRLEDSGCLHVAFSLNKIAPQGMKIILFLPAVDHELIDDSRTSSWRGKTNALIDESNTVLVGVFLKRFVSETPYLIHDTTKAPHITGSGVLLVMDGLRYT